MLVRPLPKPSTLELVDLKTIERIARMKHGEPFTKIAMEKLLREFPDVMETYDYATRLNRPITMGYFPLNV